MRALPILACLLVLGCNSKQNRWEEPDPVAPPEPAAAPPPALTEWLGEAEVVDLTQPLGPGIPVYPGTPGFESETVVTIEDDGYYLNRFGMAEHVGTHVDAPAHFVEGQATADRVEAASLAGPAAVIDVSGAAAGDPDYTLRIADLEAWERNHGRLSPRHIVLVHTGWASRWSSDAGAYRNTDDAGVMHFPGVSVEASRILRDRRVRAIGIDTLSTDPGPSTTFAQHVDFLGGGGYHIENLTNLDRLPADGAFVVVGLLPIVGGSGGPARVLAFVPRDEA